MVARWTGMDCVSQWDNVFADFLKSYGCVCQENVSVLIWNEAGVG